MLTVLVIDDDSTILTLMAAYLGSVGFHCLVAGDGRTGLELFHRSRPDIVLCDLTMPGMDGLGVLAEVKKSAPLTPFVVFSGTSDVGRAVEALRLGAWDYLLKPLPELGLLPPLLARLEERAQFLRQREHYQAQLEDEVRDRTRQLEAKLREKDLLLAEVHHRVRNNLQIIQAILGLEAERGSVADRGALAATQARLEVLALVQDQLYDHDRAPLVGAREWFPGAVHQLLSAQGLTADLVLTLEVEDRDLAPGQAIVCGLVLYEILGVLAPGPRELTIGLSSRDGGLELRVWDSVSTPQAGCWAEALARHHGGSLWVDPEGVLRVTVA